MVVRGEDIIHVVSKWTGVPLNRMEQFEHAGHHVQRAEVGGYRGEVAAVDVLDDRTLFSTWRLYLFDRDLAQSDRVLAGG